MTKSIPILATALLMTAIATPVFAQAAIQEPPARLPSITPMPMCSAVGRPIDSSINRMPITSMPCPRVIRGRSRRDIIARRDKERGLVPVA